MIDVEPYIPVFYLHKNETAMPIGHDGSSTNVPVYTRYQEAPDFHEIVVVLLFADNPPYQVLGCVPQGGHPGDIEHVRILISKETNEIVRIFYSAHGQEEGSWIERQDIEFEGGRPVVYIAKHSHALYWAPGTYYRVWFVANDHCGKHLRWAPAAVQLTLDEPWIRERFYGVSALWDRTWFHARVSFREKSWKDRVKKIFRFSK